MTLIEIFEIIASIFDTIGVAVLAIGILGGAYWFIRWQIRRILKRKTTRLESIRQFLIDRIILSLDIFIAADLIRTVARPGFTELGLLAGIIVIRIVITYSLERELHEKLPEE